MSRVGAADRGSLSSVFILIWLFSPERTDPFLDGYDIRQSENLLLLAFILVDLILMVHRKMTAEWRSPPWLEKPQVGQATVRVPNGCSRHNLRGEIGNGFVGNRCMASTRAMTAPHIFAPARP